MNPYDVLGVTRGASAAEIKQAFRRRIKELHPDLQAARGASVAAPPFSIHEVIGAYEILSDPSRRETVDRSSQSSVPEFHYREWLRQRSDPESKAKLIFYDVLRDRSAEAVALYAEMTKKRTLDLERLLGREDFMDCAFMLALEFERQGDEVQAVSLYRRIGELEQQRPFFRHFFVEVEEHLLSLLIGREFPLPAPDLVELLETLAGFPFRASARAAFLCRQAQVFWRAGERLSARRSLDRAAGLSPRDRTIAKLRQQWFVSERRLR